jgi:protease I
MEKVLLIIGEAAEVFDTLYPLHRVREDGFRVVVAAPEQRACSLVMHDRHPEWDITVESPGYKLKSAIAFRDIRPENHIGLFLSGCRPQGVRFLRWRGAAATFSRNSSG